MMLVEKLPRPAPPKAGIRVFNFRGFLQVISSAAATAFLCASVAAGEAVPVGDVMTPVAGDQTDLEILPKPKIEAYSGRALRIERAAIEAGAFADSSAARELNLLLYRGRVDEKGEGVAARFALESADPDKAKTWGRASEQGYELIVSEEGDRPSIRIRALGPAGLFYGIQTLKQLCIFKEGKLYVREGRIEDWPSIQWRGVKSADPKLIAFYAPYKMNFGWQYIALAPATGAAPARSLVEPYRDCHAEIAVSLNPGGELDLTDEYLAKVKAAFEPWLDAGVRKFVLSFDDEGARLSAETQTRFAVYADAQAWLLKYLDSWLHERDAACRLYLCHQRLFRRDYRRRARQKPGQSGPSRRSGTVLDRHRHLDAAPDARRCCGIRERLWPAGDFLLSQLAGHCAQDPQRDRPAPGARIESRRESGYLHDVPP